MSFQSLDEAYFACKELAKDRDVMLSMLKAYHYAFASLIATHPDHAQFQLHLATLEARLDVEKSYGPMSELERQAFDMSLQALQGIEPLQGRIEPLSHLKKRP